MAKKEYNIRKPLNQGFLDTEISLSPGGDGTVRPRPFKWIFFWLGSMMTLLYVIVGSPVSSASFWVKALIVVWWIVATFVFGSYSKTKEMAFMQVPAVASYHSKENREIYTRMTNDPSGFFSVARYRDIDDTAQITFADGTVGRAYEIVGNASVLSFDDDRKRILDRIEQWWRQVDMGTEWIFITAKEPQRVDRQVVQLKEQYDALIHDSPGLREVMNEKFDLLTKHVGHSFKSTHQYLIIKAEHVEGLRQSMSVLTDEVRSSPLAFRSRKALSRTATLRMLSMFTRTEDHRAEVSTKKIVKGVRP